MTTSKNPIAILAIGLGGILLLSGCSHIGPGTVVRDRSDYSAAMTESWKRQTLLNVVKLRYLDPPFFVDVGQIVAGYSLETGVVAGGSFPENNASGGVTGTLGGSAKFIDRPTITYVPMTGNRFVRGLITPIPPEALFFTIQSGWAADLLLATTVNSINGLKNDETSLDLYRTPDEAFLRAARLLRKIQGSGAIGMKIVQDKEQHRTTVITMRSEGASSETLSNIKELRQLLRLDPEASEFELTFSPQATNDREIALQTRSLMHIITAMAVRTEVPPEHISEGRTMPGIPDFDRGNTDHAQIRIRCTKSKPTHAFVSVQYRDHWFWVDDCDLHSKRAFSFVMLLFTLADTGESSNLPLITIPAQ